MSDLNDNTERLRRELDRYKRLNDSAYRELGELRRLLEAAHHREKALRANGLHSVPGDSDDVILCAEPFKHETQDGERVMPGIVDKLNRINDDSSSWLDTGETPTALSPHPGWGNLSRIGKSRIVIGVSLLGLESSRQEQIIAMIARQQLTSRQLVPLFLTDDDDFRPLRREHFVFEYLPPWPGGRTGISKETWERFLLDRLLLIRRKWGVKRFVSFHGRADARVAASVEAAWKDSSADS